MVFYCSLNPSQVSLMQTRQWRPWSSCVSWFPFSHRVCPSSCVLTVLDNLLHCKPCHFALNGRSFAQDFRFCSPWCSHRVAAKKYSCRFGNFLRCCLFSTHHSLLRYYNAHNIFEFSEHGNLCEYEVFPDTLLPYRYHQNQCYWWFPTMMESFHLVSVF